MKKFSQNFIGTGVIFFSILLAASPARSDAISDMQQSVLTLESIQGTAIKVAGGALGFIVGATVLNGVFSMIKRS